MWQSENGDRGLAVSKKKGKELVDLIGLCLKFGAGAGGGRVGMGARGSSGIRSARLAGFQTSFVFDSLTVNI